MSRAIVIILLTSVTLGVGYWAGSHQPSLGGVFDKARAIIPDAMRPNFLAKAETPKMTGSVIYYRDPDGKPEWSLELKKTIDGRNYIGVSASEDLNFNSEVQSSKSAETMPNAGEKKIKYYRNPMGLPDTSPAPKKDSMGMDYIAVYDGDEPDDGSIKLSVGKLQRTGVRSEPVTLHNFSATIRAPGVIALDERRQSVMSLRFEGWVEKIEDVTTGTTIKKGQPLFRVYGPELSAAAAQYVSILGSTSDGSAPAIKGARRRLENLGVPDSVIAEMTRAREVPLTLVWPAPRDGIVTERNISEGMRAMPGDALFKIADVSTVWALADVAERDLAQLAVGQQAIVRPRNNEGSSFQGKISVIYPSLNKETRTARVRIELANSDGLLKPDMYLDVEIAAGSAAPMLAVPENAVIDSGDKQAVILDMGDGKFLPRAVKTGQRGQGFVQIREGLADGDKIVTSANFLIDAESNLKAALQGLTPLAEAATADIKTGEAK